MDDIDIRVPVHVRRRDDPDGFILWFVDAGIRRIADEDAPVVASFARHEYRAFEGRLWVRKRLQTADLYDDQGYGPEDLVVDETSFGIEQLRRYPIRAEYATVGRSAWLRRRAKEETGERFDDAERAVLAQLKDTLVLDGGTWEPTMGPGVLATPWKRHPAQYLDVQYVVHGYVPRNDVEAMGLFSLFDTETVNEVVTGNGQTPYVITVMPKVMTKDGWSPSDASRSYANDLLRHVLASMAKASKEVSVGVGGREMVALTAQIGASKDAQVEEMLLLARRFERAWPQKGYANPIRDRQWRTALEVIERLDIQPVLEAEQLSDFSI